MSSQHAQTLAESHSHRRRPRPRVVGGTIGALALSTALVPGSALAAGGSPTAVPETPAETTAPTIAFDSAGLYEATEATTRAAQTLETEAHREAAAAKAREDAAAFKKAEERRKAEEARKAAAERATAAAAASRDSARTALSVSVDTGTSTGTGTGVLGFLRAQLGKAYVMGATGPGAYDCSGLVQAAFRTVGVNLPRTSQAQSSAVTPVSLSAVQPGDLLFWGGQGSAYHVAVYVGNGKYIDAANPGKGVVEQNVSDWPPDFAGRV